MKTATITYKHRVFLQKNDMKPNKLPEGIYRKIKVFDRMEESFTKTPAEKPKDLLDKLRRLDREIYQDLLSEMEDQLAYCELEDTAPAVEAPKAIQKEKPPTLTGDEKILADLYKMGRTEGLSRSLLRELGIQAQLSRSEIQVGNFLLTRTSIFFYTYRLKERSLTGHA